MTTLDQILKSGMCGAQPQNGKGKTDPGQILIQEHLPCNKHLSPYIVYNPVYYQQGISYDTHSIH